MEISMEEGKEGKGRREGGWGSGGRGGKWGGRGEEGGEGGRVVDASSHSNESRMLQQLRAQFPRLSVHLAQFQGMKLIPYGQDWETWHTHTDNTNPNNTPRLRASFTVCEDTQVLPHRLKNPLHSTQEH